MFSALNQGSHVYILDKTNEIDFKVGEVVGTTTPMFATDGSNMMVINLKVKVNDTIMFPLTIMLLVITMVILLLLRLNNLFNLK